MSELKLFFFLFALILADIIDDMDYGLEKTTKNCLLKLYAKLNKPQAQLARTVSLPIINNVQKYEPFSFF
jgi:hypothetical protein